MNGTELISFSDFEEGIRKAVLDGMDEFCASITGNSAAGWLAPDLPAIFSAIHAHAITLAGRINDASSPGSADLSIKMDE